MNKFTATHFIPLVGPWSIACKELTKEGEFEMEEKYFFSLPPFAGNEVHLPHNYGHEFDYLSMDLLPDYDDGNKWMSNESYKNYIQEQKIASTNFQLSLPPCAGLSMLNNANRGADNASNRWMYEAVKWYLAQSNDVLIIENAPGLYGDKGEPVVKTVKDIIEYNGLGEDIAIHLIKTSTSKHGIPQNRPRTFLYLYKKSLLDGNYAKFKNLNNVTPHVKDFLKRSFEEDPSIDHVHQAAEKNSPTLQYIRAANRFDEFRGKAVEFFKTNPKRGTMGTWAHLIEEYRNDETVFDILDEESKQYKTLVRVAKKNIAKLADNKGYWDDSVVVPNTSYNAVTAKTFGTMLHPTYDRLLTYREIMDMMGYPTEFKIKEVNKNWNHICQNMPIKTGIDQLKWAIGIFTKDDRYLADTIDGENISVLKASYFSGDVEKNIGYYDKNFVYCTNLKSKPTETVLTDFFK